MKVVAVAIAATLGAAVLASSSGPSGPLDTNIFVNLAKKTVPSVVNISTYTTVKSPYSQMPETDVLRRFFEEMLRRRDGGGDDDDALPAPGAPGPGGSRAMALGTGFVIDPAGIILTNNHVVGDSDEIKVSFTEAEDEKPTDGEVIGRDPELDLALIKVKTGRPLVALPLGDSDALEVGEYVVAVGNPFGQGHSVTHGIVSAKGRAAPELPLMRYLQTDAPINPGNSGGPLVNLRGEVIGINNAIDQRAQNIGFAIPINSVKQVLAQLKTKGSVTRGYIGVLARDLTPELAEKLGAPKDLRAPFVTEAYAGEPAAKAGIKNYDVILELNHKPVHSFAELIVAVTAFSSGETVPVKLIRAGKTQELSLKVGQRPGSEDEGKAAGKNKKNGKKKKPSLPTVDTGMSVEDITPDIARELGLPPELRGVVIASVQAGGPADEAGLARGDVILEVDRKPLKDVEGFYKAVRARKSYLLRVRETDGQGREEITVVLLTLS
jgi:serine protease Do